MIPINKWFRSSRLKEEFSQKGFPFFFIDFFLRIIFYPINYQTKVKINNHKLRTVKNNLAFDIIYQTDTYKYEQINDLKLSSNNKSDAYGYIPTPINIFLPVISKLPINFKDFTYLDIGSGKGRTLLLATRFKFKEIIGIEFSPELNNIANKNISSYLSINPFENQISSKCVDACEYVFPKKPFVLFMYNPFNDKIIKKFLNRIEVFLKDNDLEIYIIYYNPQFDYIFSSSSYLYKLKEGDKGDTIRYISKGGILTKLDYPCSIYSSRKKILGSRI